MMRRFSAFKNAISSDGSFIVLILLVTSAVGYHWFFVRSAPNGYEGGQGTAIWEARCQLQSAVMIATGRGCVEPAMGSPRSGGVTAPDIGRFLRHEIPLLRPEQIPADLPTKILHRQILPLTLSQFSPTLPRKRVIGRMLKGIENE